MLARVDQSSHRYLQIQCLRAVLLGQLFSIRTQYQRAVQVLWLRQTEGALQQDLTRGVVGQVLPAHDVGDALSCIIYHHSQLVGPQAVCPFKHKVADLGADILAL